MFKTVSNFDVRDVWWQGMTLAGHLQDLDFGMFLGRGIGHDSCVMHVFHFRFIFIYLFIYLFIHSFIYLLIYLFIYIYFLLLFPAAVYFLMTSLRVCN